MKCPEPGRFAPTRLVFAVALMGASLPVLAESDGKVGPEFRIDLDALLPGGAAAVPYHASNGDILVASATRYRRLGPDGTPKGPLVTVTPAAGTFFQAFALGVDGKVLAVSSSTACPEGLFDRYCLYARRYSAAGTRIDAAPILLDHGAHEVYETGAAIDPAGNFVVGSTSYDPDVCFAGGARFYSAQRYSAADAHVETLVRGGGNQIEVTMDPAGDFLVAAHDYTVTGGGYDEGCERSPDAVSLGRYSAAGVATGSNLVEGGTITDFSVALDPAGDIQAAYASDLDYGNDDGSVGPYARRFDASGVPQTPGPIVVDTQIGTLQTAIAPFGDRGSAIVWDRYISSDSRNRYLRLHCYAADGSSLDGADVLVNTSTTNFPRNPRIAPAADGSFVVYWTDELAPYHTLYGQAFEPAGAGGPDVSPDPFTFRNKVAPATGATVISTDVIVSGLGPAGASVSVGGQPSARYQVSRKGYTHVPGTIHNGEHLRLSVQASALPGGNVKATVTVGDYTTGFHVKTR